MRVKHYAMMQPLDALPALTFNYTLEQLSPDDREYVRQANLDFIERTALRNIEANVIYATGRAN